MPYYDLDKIPCFQLFDVHFENFTNEIAFKYSKIAIKCCNIDIYCLSLLNMASNEFYFHSNSLIETKEAYLHMSLLIYRKENDHVIMMRLKVSQGLTILKLNIITRFCS